MTKARFALTAVGNAIVDIIATTTDAFLEKENIIKGAMNLIDEQRAKHLYAEMGPAHEVSGGSAANTLAGFASFGGYGAFIGKVANDQLGDIFMHDMKAHKVELHCSVLEDGPATGRSYILVTPDAQRSMNTFLGASVEFDENDIDETIIADSEIVYLEGYLFDRPQAKRAYMKASKIAQEAGRKSALCLSDSFCVKRHKAEFLDLIQGHMDIVFANEDEVKELFDTDDLNIALDALRPHTTIAAITCGEKGSIVLNGAQQHEIKAAPVSQVVDTTGAGDQYAAGFLYGLSLGLPLEQCGWYGSLAASEVISHIGPRPETPLKDLIAA
jgi:sugar/nucleoside kinase (ribokinase family)